MEVLGLYTHTPGTYDSNKLEVLGSYTHKVWELGGWGKECLGTLDRQIKHYTLIADPTSCSNSATWHSRTWVRSGVSSDAGSRGMPHSLQKVLNAEIPDL